MKTWLRRLRGALSLGVLGSFAGALIGAGWEIVSTLLAGAPVNVEILIFFTLFGATVGGASGLGFSVLVGSLGARTTLDGLSTRKAGLWGGVAGAAAACLAGYWGTGALLPFLQQALPIVVVCSGIGAALGSGVVRVAQAAAAEELGPGGGRRNLIGDGRDEDVG